MKKNKKSPKKVSFVTQVKQFFLKRYALYLPFLIGFLFVICCFFVYRGIVLHTHRPLIESPRTDMQRIPADVKKQLAEQAKTVTVSAALRVPILMYHYVEYVQDKKDTIRQSLNVDPNVFESQLQTLIAAHYTFITAKDLGEVIDGKAQLPPNPIVLTFDDGHWDFETNVLPMLEKYHIPATAYIISGFLGGSDFMTPQELQTVVNSGLIDVGAHTVHHIPLKGVIKPVATYEIIQSQKQLESAYHIHIVSFAYPSGSFDEQAIQIVKNAGYTTAVSTIPGIQQSNDNRFFLYRLRPGYRTGQVLLNYLSQNFF